MSGVEWLRINSAKPFDPERLGVSSCRIFGQRTALDVGSHFSRGYRITP